MLRKRSWTDQDLQSAVKESKSIRQVLIALRLQPKGGNYAATAFHIARLQLDTSHFTGMRWNKGLTYQTVARRPLKDMLVANSDFQSFKLKKRLFEAGIKTAACELCGWSQVSSDGRVPVELDHINGNHRDNRLENLRILCPNCHSLQPTHRGRNKKTKLTK